MFNHVHFNTTITQNTTYKTDINPWSVSRSLTTQNLLSVISVANTMMELPTHCFRRNVTTNNGDISTDDVESDTAHQGQVVTF